MRVIGQTMNISLKTVIISLLLKPSGVSILYNSDSDSDSDNISQYICLCQCFSDDLTHSYFLNTIFWSDLWLKNCSWNLSLFVTEVTVFKPMSVMSVCAVSGMLYWKTGPNVVFSEMSKSAYSKVTKVSENLIYTKLCLASHHRSASLCQCLPLVVAHEGALLWINATFNSSESALDHIQQPPL